MRWMPAKFGYTNWLLVAAVIVLFTACERDDEGLPPDSLSVTRFEPLAALGNDTITIVGTGFSERTIENVVQFTYAEGTPVKDQVLATVISASATTLQVVVPEIAQVGRVKVGVGPYTALSDVPFLLSPSISSVNPEGGFANDLITIQGKNFPTDLTKLLLFIGEVKVDSIFGGSSTQIVFPLPEGLAPGRTTIRVGILLTPTDSVFAPAADFTVFDPNTPSITGIEPSSTVPGGTIVLRGNAFKSAGGTTTVKIIVNGTEYAVTPDPADLSNDAVTVQVPASITVSDEVAASVTITVVTAGGQNYVSEPAFFTLVEPSDIVFYYTALNAPGATDADNILYSAQPIPGVEPVQLATGANLGVHVQEAQALVYYGAGTSVGRCNLDGSNLEVFTNIQNNGSDVAVNAANQLLYYYNYDSPNDLFQYTLATQAYATLVSDYLITHVKNEGTQVFWGGKGFPSAGRIEVVSGGTSTNLYTNASIGAKFITGLAVTADKIYFAEGPTSAIQAANTPGTSTIYVMNRDGSGVGAVYSNLSEIITDLEISEDGTTLYWMSSSDNAATGGIRSAPSAPDPAKIKTIVPNIRNGRYFDLLETD